MNSAKLKETIANIVKEESEYQLFFKKALEKAGKPITDMSDEEKKEFFNKIDAAWDGKGEKNEGNAFGAAVVAAKKAGEDEFEVGGKTYKVEESVNEEEIKWNAVQNAIINFLKANTKILEKRVQAKDTEGVKGGLKSIINGLTNAQRSLKLESVNEASYVSGYTVKAKTPYEFVNGAYAVLSAYLRDEQLGPKGKKELQNILKSLEYMRKYFFFNLNESVNEAASRTAMEIGALTGLNKDAVQKFVDTHNMDIEKVYQYVKKAKLTDRLNFVTAIVGTPGNPVQKRMIKMFGESVNEDTKKRFDVDFYKVLGDRQTSHEEIIRGDKFSDVISQAIKVAKSKGMNYVEFYHKDAFIGSVDKKSNYTFKKGRNSEKSPLPVTELKKLSSGNFSIKKGYNTFADYEKNAKVGDNILRYDKRGQMIKTFVNGSELDKNAEKYIDKVNNITGGVVYLSKKGMKGVAQVPDYEKKEVGVLVLESKSVNEGRAFINAARKAKAEGKTEFEFNGKKYPVTLKEGTLNEMNPQLNKGVKSLLDKELKDLRKGGSNHLFAVMNILMGALTDSNFHSESKKVPTIFGSKAKYEGDPMAQRDMESLYQSIGERIATMAKWDGEDIAKAVGFYVSMTIGRPLGQKIENLV